MTSGDCVRWYTDHGWAYGRLQSVGYKHAHIRRAGKLVKVPKDRVHVMENRTALRKGE